MNAFSIIIIIIINKILIIVLLIVMCVQRYVVGVNYIFNRKIRGCVEGEERDRVKTTQILEGIGNLLGEGRE